MKFLVDANLSPVVARRLAAAGHDATHVVDLGLTTASDVALLEVAAEADRVIVSADADFGALLTTGSRSGPSLILLRSPDHLRPDEQAALILDNLPQLAGDLASGAIASIGRGRLRVRRLAT